MHDGTGRLGGTSASARARYACVAVAFLFACGGCEGPRDTTVRPGRTTSVTHPGDSESKEPRLETPVEKSETLITRLSEREPAAERRERAPAARTEPLPESEVSALLARLPPLDDEHDGRELALPPDSRPRPRTGETARDTFPPGLERGPPPEAEQLPVRAERFAPEGEVKLAPHVSITFNQPMIAVTSHQASVSEPPLRLEPEPPGRWRWVGTRTLLFEMDGRLPMATRFEAVVPAGTSSATGVSLARDVRWSFETPPPSIESSWPPSRRPARRDTAVVLVFDQRIDRAAVLDRLRVTAGGESVLVRAAAEEEIESFPEAKSLVEESKEDRWVAFVPIRPLPGGSSVRVEIPAGTPSAEGPLTTEADAGHSFRTYGPFEVRSRRCPGRCEPGTTWSIGFTNPVDPELFEEERHVRIEPELPAARVDVSGSQLRVIGLPRANTSYSVHLSPKMKDVFGQELEASEPLVFDVGPARPRFLSHLGSMTVLDPAGAPKVEVHTIGFTRLEVAAHSVEPGDLADYERWIRGGTDEVPGRKAFERRLEVGGHPDEASSTEIDLSDALEGDLGQVVLHIEGFPKSEQRWIVSEQKAWLQRTRIGLMAWHADTLEVLATSMESGEPLSGVRLSLSDDEGEERPGAAATDEGGLASLPLETGRARLLIARRDGDLAILSPGAGRFGAGRGFNKLQHRDRLVFYVTDDRAMYRPGESVHFKGWVRMAEGGPEGDLGAVGGGTVRWRARDPRGGELAGGQAEIDDFGGFSFHLEIPEDANLGHAHLLLETRDTPLHGTARHTFQIQQFRRPEFEVEARGSEAPHFLGEKLGATVSASYYTGQPLPAADVVWTVSSRQGSYRPPGHEGFSFGRPVRFFGWMARGAQPTNSGLSDRLTGLTAADGSHSLEVELPGGPPFPTSLTAEARVTDVNRQAWAASTSFLVHPAAAYVGMATEGRFIRRHEDLKVDLVATDLDGEMRPGREIEVEARRMGFRQRGRSFEEKVEETRTCDMVSAAAPVSCAFETLESGRWLVAATVRDDAGRASRTEIVRWVSGAPASPPVSRVEREEVVLIPQKDEHAPGDVARVLAQLPFHPADVIVTLRREGLLFSERVRVEGPDHTIEVPITERMTPGAHLRVAVAGIAPRAGPEGEPDPALPPRPAFGHGELYLSVPPSDRKLEVVAEPEAGELEPGGETNVRVMVRDHLGEPVETQVLVMAVDEAVLALTDHRPPDPLEVFYGRRRAGVLDSALYSSVLLADLDPQPEEEGAAGDAGEAAPADGAIGMGGMGARPEAMQRRARMARAPASAPAEKAQPPPIAVRTDLTPLALFSPAVSTGADGIAEVPLELPDSLTRYRIMAVATDGAKRFGTGESTVTARLPLMVRPSLPRFMSLGDHAELPLVVQNQTAEAMTVSLAARAAGLELERSGLEVVVPPKDRVEVRLPAAPTRVGPVRLQLAAASGSWSDAAEVEIPVWTPATTEAFATYGTIDDGAIRQPVEAPADARADFGGLEMTTSSTELQALTDAVIYLAGYPFRFTEPAASRILAISSLVDVLDAFESEDLPAPERLREAVEQDIETLVARQGQDGGFAPWTRPRRTDETWPYLTTYVTLALVTAAEKGFEVPENALRRALRYLQEIERHIPSCYPRQVRWTTRAAALFVLERAGMTEGGKARALLAEATVAKLNLEAQGLLLPVLAADRLRSEAEISAIERHLHNRVSETAAGATFTTRYEEGAHLLFHSTRRSDAIILEGLMAARPDSDLVTKTVRGLLAHRSRGRWSNTQENGWVLLALDSYFRKYEGVTPRFVARVWLGERFAGEHRFAGRTTERHHVSVPMAWLAGRGAREELALHKDGPGRLYYRLGLRYVPEDLTPPPAEHGFSVERTYEAIDDPEDVVLEEDGTWRVRAGAPVRVRLTMVAPARRYHVALVDRLPAGFEPMNPALAVTGTLPQDPAALDRSGGRFWFWWRTWYEHQNLRDERAEAFASILWAGVHEYSYVARATTPGRFVAPPPTAEEMYHPETFGRGRGEIVVVEEVPERIAGR